MSSVLTIHPEFEAGNEKKYHRVSKETMDYFVKTKRILDHFNPENSENEEIEIIKDRVLAEIAGKESIFVRNVVSSRVIEMLLYNMNSNEIISLLVTLGKEAVDLAKDQYASHVLQKLLTIVSSLIDDKSYSDSFKDIFRILRQLVKFSSKLFLDPYGTFVMRTLIELIGHINVNNKLKTRTRENDMRTKNEILDERHKFYNPLPQNYNTCVYVKLFQKLGRKFNKLSLENDVLNDSNAGILFCYIILASHNLDSAVFETQYEFTFSRIMDLYFDYDKNISKILAKNIVSSFVLQTLFVFTENAEFHDNLFQIFIKKDVVSLLDDNISSNVIKAAICSLKNPDLAKRIFKDIIVGIKSCSSLSINHVSILSSIVTISSSLQLFDNSMYSSILGIFKSNKNIVLSIITMKSYCENLQDESIVPVSCHLLCCLFDQEVCLSIFQDFHQLSFKEINRLACDPSGSRVVDAYFNSQFVTFDDKNSLLNSFSDENILALAKNKYGSFCMENMWKYFAKARKSNLAQYFLSNSHFKYNSFGKLLAKKLKLEIVVDPKSRFKSKNRY